MTKTASISEKEILAELLNGNNFLEIRKGQLLFRENGHYALFQIEENKTYTAEDYFSLPEGIPYQLLCGKLTFMPSPNAEHQRISRELFLDLGFFLRVNKIGEVLAAPMDVNFGEKNVVQPDILFISNENSIIENKKINGAPDFIVEILSGNVKDDRVTKMKLYGEKGVKEYWLIDPELKTLEIYINQNGKMQVHEILEEQHTAKSVVISGFEIALEKLFK